MSKNLEDARGHLEDAGKCVFLAMGTATTDEQQESLGLMEKGINEVKALISDYECKYHRRSGHYPDVRRCPG